MDIVSNDANLRNMRDQGDPAGVERFSEADRQKIAEIAQQIDVEDTQFVLQYGVGAQSKVSNFADTVLSEVRVKDSGYVGEIITNLMLKVKELDVDSLEHKGGLLSRIPFFGTVMDAAQKFLARYQKLSVEIEKIIDELDASRMQLLKDITMLDHLFEKNLEYFQELEIYIEAGKLKLSELQEKVIPEMKAMVDVSNDPLTAQKYNDLTQLVNRFEKKIHDLQLSRMIAIQTAPQIRLIQNNNQVLVEKIQSSLLNTIPLWKNQMVIAISLFRQKKALEQQKEVTQTTNELLLKNAEMLKEGSVEIARESERGIVEIDTLKKVNADLISTLDETLRIQEEGKVKRQQAEVELLRIEQELKNKLTALKG